MIAHCSDRMEGWCWNVIPLQLLFLWVLSDGVVNLAVVSSSSVSEVNHISVRAVSWGHLSCANCLRSSIACKIPKRFYGYKQKMTQKRFQKSYCEMFLWPHSIISNINVVPSWGLSHLNSISFGARFLPVPTPCLLTQPLAISSIPNILSPKFAGARWSCKFNDKLITR